MSDNNDDEFLLLEREEEEDKNDERTHHAVPSQRKTPRRQAVRPLAVPKFDSDDELDELDAHEPELKRSRVPMMTPETKKILGTYGEGGGGSHQRLNQIYDKNWKNQGTAQQFEDAMDIDDPPMPSITIRESDYKKELFEKTKPAADLQKQKKKKLETKIIDEPIEGQNNNNKKASGTGTATASIMSPSMLNERYHDIASQTSKILNDSMRKLLAVDKSVYDNNIESESHIKVAMVDFIKLFQALDVRIFNPDHVPSTIDDGMDVPSIPLLLRTYIQKYMREAIFENHERGCSRGENCESHKMWLQYKIVTAGNTAAGPQFPPNSQSFCLRELLLPAVEQEIVERLARGENMAEIMRSIKPQVCYLCHLTIVNDWVIMAASKNKPIVAPTVLQPFMIKIGTPGEYTSDALLSCGSNNLYGLVAPFPEFVYSNYIPFQYTVPLNNSNPSQTKMVLGWAEVNEIICEPSTNLKPRGYDGESPIPTPGQGYFSSLSS